TLAGRNLLSRGDLPLKGNLFDFPHCLPIGCNVIVRGGKISNLQGLAMRNSADSTKAVCDRRDLLKLAGGALFGNAAVRLGLTASVAATGVMVAALPIYAQPEKKEITEMRSSEKFNGKVMFDWMTDLKDKDVSVRERAIASLKVYGKAAREAAPLIIKAIKDPDMSLRVNAIITLG